MDYVDDPPSLLKVFKNVNKEILKECFHSIDIANQNEVKLRLSFLSTLPLSYLNKTVRQYLFMVLYYFEYESKNCMDFEDVIGNIYSGNLLTLYYN